MKRLTGSQASPLCSVPLIDSHIHLDSEEYADDWRQVREVAEGAGVDRLILPATDVGSSRRIAEMSREDGRLYRTAGIHPHQAASYCPAAAEELEALAPGCVAVGETGLESYYDFCPIDVQLASLRFQLGLARRLHLPLILHCRESEALLLEELGNAGPFPAGGVVHCFTGGWEWAQKFLALGFHLGVNGLVTLPKADLVHEVARECPLDRLLLETDGPYLAPQPHRGRRNEPCLIPLIAQEVARLRGAELESIARATRENTMRLFDLDRKVASGRT